MPVAAVLVAGVVLAAAGQTPAPHEGMMTVSIVASVLTKRGILVSDLTQDDFDVFDNGKRQPLTIFKNEVVPISMVILVDRSGSLGWDPGVVWQTAERFVSTALLTGDKARAGTFSSKILIAPPDFTSDREAILKGLRDSTQGAGWTPLWNATSAAIEALSAQSGRRVVMIVSQNRDAPDKTGANSSLADVRARALSSGVVVFAFGMSAKLPHGAVPPMSQQGQSGRGGGGRSGGATAPLTPSDDAAPDPGLKILTDETGGDYFEFEHGLTLPDSFGFLADELHHQYMLGFTATTLDGKVHTLDVRVKQPGLTVKARKTYVASQGK